MNRVRKMMHADEIHQEGIRGKGITVAVVDSGISMHPDFGDRILCFQDYVYHQTKCYDDASHGTHVSGIIGGNGKMLNGKFCGIAPECNLISIKVLDRFGHGRVENFVRAVRWITENREAYQIRVLNLSAGTSREDEEADAVLEVVEEAWNAGIIVIAAAGNKGPGQGKITVPGISRKIITVGSCDRYLKKTGWQEEYSSCGPTEECICKPELAAPGNRIVSCCASWNRGRYYEMKSGTSMSAPVIAGSVALLLSKQPHISNVEVKMKLKQSAVSAGLPFYREGWGVPDLRKLI